MIEKYWLNLVSLRRLALIEEIFGRGHGELAFAFDKKNIIRCTLFNKSNPYDHLIFLTQEHDTWDQSSNNYEFFEQPVLSNLVKGGRIVKGFYPLKTIIQIRTKMPLRHIFILASLPQLPGIFRKRGGPCRLDTLLIRMHWSSSAR